MTRQGRGAAPSGLRLSLARAVIVIGVLGIGLAGPPAGADPPDPVVPSGPSQEEIDEARHAEQLAEASVAEIEAMLDTLRAKTEKAEVEAALAAEAYNAAAEKLRVASDDVDAAEQEATKAAGSLSVARGALARVAVSASESQSALAGIEPFFSADGITDAVRRAELIYIAGTSTRRATDRFAIAEQAAVAATVRAEGAVSIREEKKTEAERAAEAAERAAIALEDEQEAVEHEHAALLTELAAKKQTTLELERQAEAARIAAENEAARRAAEQRQREEAARKAAKEAEEKSEEKDRLPEGITGEFVDEPEVVPTPPSSTGSVSSAASAQAALDWARRQIGKPYRWGGSGPDSFDCSGLTSQAWLNGAGKWITRTAASQYAAATKVAFDQMRPGDLIFWGSSAETIYHVALYSGDGMMVEAPRPGKNISELAIRWSGVYGYAGRF